MYVSRFSTGGGRGCWWRGDEPSLPARMWVPPCITGPPISRWIASCIEAVPVLE